MLELPLSQDGITSRPGLGHGVNSTYALAAR